MVIMHSISVLPSTTDSEWNLQSRCVQANHMPEDHTGKHLQDTLSTSFTEW